MNCVQLRDYDMMLLNCDWIHDYKLCLLLIVVDNPISWLGYELWLKLLYMNWVVVEGFVKMGWIGEWCWNNIWFHVWDVFWKPFWVHIPVNKLWKHIWVLGDQNWGFWVKNGKNPKVVVHNCDCTLKRAPSVQPPVATGPCTLKRTGARLSVQAQFQHHKCSSTQARDLQSNKITKKYVWVWTLDIQSVMFTIQNRNRLLRLLIL